MPKIDWDKFKSSAMEQIDKPYKFGAKWPLGDPDPQGPVDCSGFTRWVFSRVGIFIPDGSYDQYLASQKPAIPQLGDLGFFKRGDEPCYHVGILLDDKWVIEARGDPHNKVFLREREKWERWKFFTGWMRPDEVYKRELA